MVALVGTKAGWSTFFSSKTQNGPGLSHSIFPLQIFLQKTRERFPSTCQKRKQKDCVTLNRVSPNRPSPRKILDPVPRTEKSSFFLEKNLAGKLTMRSGCGSSMTRLENPMVVARKLRQAVYNRIKCGPVLETFACWNKVELFLFSSGSFYLFQTFLSNS